MIRLLSFSMILLALTTASGCASMAINSTTAEIYVLQGKVVKVCAVSDDGKKLDCPKRYKLPG